MKQLIYCLIIAMSISLSFSGGKPCCKKKAGKNAVSCKFNHVAVESEKDISGTLNIEDTEVSPNASKCITSDGSKCANNTKKTWWKFWAKKSTNNCPCKQAVSTG